MSMERRSQTLGGITFTENKVILVEDEKKCIYKSHVGLFNFALTLSLFEL